MTDTNYDPWKLSTGLLDEYSGTVLESWAGVNPAYNANATLMFWKVELDTPELYPQIEGGIIREQYSLGGDWVTYDGGETVEKPGQSDPHFGANSQYGQIIKSAVDWGLKDVLAERGDPRTMGIWVGLRFRFEAQPGRDFRDRTTGEMRKGNPKVMPVEYLGEDAGVRVEPGFDVDALGLDDETVEQLRTHATKTDTPAKFLDAVMKDEQLTALRKNGKVVAALADKKFHEALRPF